MENKKYTLETLEIFKKKYLHTYDLQYADRKDLYHDLVVKALQLAQDKRLQYDAPDTDTAVKYRYTYLIRAYRNFVSNWYRKRRNKKMTAIEINDMSAIFSNRFLHYNQPDENATPYYEYPFLQHLTAIEQKVLVLKANHTYREIEHLLADNYDYDIGSYKRIYKRAKKKLLDEYPILSQKWGWAKYFENN